MNLQERIINIAPSARPYQIKAIEDIYKAFSRGDKHIILQAPTGTGKTFIFSVLSKLINEKGNKVLVLTHRHKLLKQAGASFKSFGLNPFFVQAGIKYAQKERPFSIGMTRTLENKSKDETWNEWIRDRFIIIDECHLQHFNWLFESGLIDDNYVVGFSATPKRSGKQRQLGLDYDTIIETISVLKGIKDGHLVNCDLYNVKCVSSKNVKWDNAKGDYQDKSMFNAFNNNSTYAGLLKNYDKLCPNTKTIVFCCNIEHTIKTAIELNNKGYKVKYIVSKVNKPSLPKDLDDEVKMAEYYAKCDAYDLYTQTYDKLSGNQEEVLEEFENNEFQFLLNKDILTAGYDCPDIETVIIYRLTQSISLWLQMLGRGSRISLSTGKTHFNVLYFGDNLSDLGAYDDDREWFLYHEETKGEGLPPVKFCGTESSGKPIKGKTHKEGCKRMIPASWKMCKKCGYVYPEKDIVEAELSGISFSDGAFIKHKRIKDMSFDELEKHRSMKNYKMPWLWRILYARGGIDLIEKYGKDNKWAKGTIDLAKKIVLK